MTWYIVIEKRTRQILSAHKRKVRAERSMQELSGANVQTELHVREMDDPPFMGTTLEVT